MSCQEQLSAMEARRSAVTWRVNCREVRPAIANTRESSGSWMPRLSRWRTVPIRYSRLGPESPSRGTNDARLFADRQRPGIARMRTLHHER